MLIPLIPAVLPDGDGGGSGAGGGSGWVDRCKQLSVTGLVQVDVGSDGVADATVNALKPALRAAPCRVGPFKAAQVDAAVSTLDAGALAVVFDLDAGAGSSGVEDLAEALATLQPHRVLVHVRDGSAVEHEVPTSGGAPVPPSAVEPIASTAGGASHVIKPHIAAALVALKSYVAGFVLDVRSLDVPGEVLKAVKGLAGALAPITLHLVAPASAHAAEVGRLQRHDVNVLAPATIALSNEEVEAHEAVGTLDVGSCIAACARSDRPDGLFTTVVADECGKTLGLVYSSKESIVEAIRAGRGVYYSRSRGGLWRKGDTSGAWQALRSIALDCDSDALLFRVQQMGAIPAFCHLNTRTCWGEDSGLTSLERTLAARRVDAPPGSYTKRLFDDHELLKHKLLEEAQELAEASEPDHIAAEAADVMYFAMVACAKAGVTLADVEAHLDRRALKIRRRPGDSKPARIAAAKAHFEAYATAAGSATGAVAGGKGEDGGSVATEAEGEGVKA